MVSDGLALSCDNGERVRVAFALDCCDREVMSWVATTKGIDAALVGDLMMQALEFESGNVTCDKPREQWHVRELRQDAQKRLCKVGQQA